MDRVVVSLRAADAEPSVNAALAIELTQMLAVTAHRATELNWNAVRTMLPDTRAEDEPATLTAWRSSWNAYQLCTTTARHVARVSAEHAHAQQDALWRVAEAVAAHAGTIDATRLNAIRTSIERVQTAVDTFVAATDAALRELARHAKEA
jgi:hypothetical protein